MINSLLLISLLIFLCGPAQVRQTEDPHFDPKTDNPACFAGKGPVLLIGEAHNNFHTATGRYEPLAGLMCWDGYRVAPITGGFTSECVEKADVLVIANTLQKSNSKSWTPPTPSAFTAQLSGPQKAKIGMNNPNAGQSCRFVLNVMHWLSGSMHAPTTNAQLLQGPEEDECNQSHHENKNRQFENLTRRLVSSGRRTGLLHTAGICPGL